jgi:hypothetical protein
MRHVLVNPNWTFDLSIYFGCQEAHLPLGYGYAAALLNQHGHQTEIVDGELEDLTLDTISTRVRDLNPDVAVVTTAPSYLFWRCPPPGITCPPAASPTAQFHRRHHNSGRASRFYHTMVNPEKTTCGCRGHGRIGRSATKVGGNARRH